MQKLTNWNSWFETPTIFKTSYKIWINCSETVKITSQHWFRFNCSVTFSCTVEPTWMNSTVRRLFITTNCTWRVGGAQRRSSHPAPPHAGGNNGNIYPTSNTTGQGWRAERKSGKRAPRLFIASHRACINPFTHRGKRISWSVEMWPQQSYETKQTGITGVHCVRTNGASRL